MSESFHMRVAAIVGRPNVGKSALFNRLVGRRLSIVHEESGVTRDRLVAEATWKDERFELMDTGGITPPAREETRDTITAGMRRQVEVAMEDASALILVVDITGGLTALDEEVAHVLRDSGRPVIVAANKADHEGLDDAAADFERLGFPVVPVSALHNRGIDELLERMVRKLPPAVDEEGVQPLRVAIVGRPNVGKSSYVNRLLRSDRVIVSDVPGTTRDSIEIPFTVGQGPQARHYRLIDTAGIRRRGKIKDAVERFSLMRTEKSVEDADVVVHLLDATQGPTAQDKTIATMIREKHKGSLLLVNKWDLAEKKVTQRAYTKALIEAVPFFRAVPLIYASAESGYNIRKSIEVIDHVASQLRLEVTTGLLNRVLHDAFARVQPPLRGGKRLKLYYATQVGTRPVRIRLFVNHPGLRNPAYETYLHNLLRDVFGLEGAPIILQWRSHR